MTNHTYEKKFSLMDKWGDTVREDLVRIISDSPSSIVYHYTDVNGLIGIVTSGCIRATHVNRLNDSSENKLGFELVQKYVRKNMPKASRPLFEKVLSEFQSVDTYVACYSTENDLLGQWRNYTGTQVGYSLGFDTSQMATLDDKLPPLEAVIYDQRIVEILLDSLIKRVDEFLNNNSFGDIEVGYLLGMVNAMLNIVACITKYPKFEEEKEYRHIYQPGKTGLELTPCFKSGRFGLTPYVEIKFLKSGYLPLKSVTIGPCQDFNLEFRTLKILLQSKGYGDLEILKSEIPLRM